MNRQQYNLFPQNDMQLSLNQGSAKVLSSHWTSEKRIVHALPKPYLGSRRYKYTLLQYKKIEIIVLKMLAKAVDVRERDHLLVAILEIITYVKTITLKG